MHVRHTVPKTAGAALVRVPCTRERCDERALNEAFTTPHSGHAELAGSALEPAWGVGSGGEEAPPVLGGVSIARTQGGGGEAPSALCGLSLGASGVPSP